MPTFIRNNFIFHHMGGSSFEGNDAPGKNLISHVSIIGFIIQTDKL